jgi:UDP-N-acetyl-D-galactosamine dehydrogenase
VDPYYLTHKAQAIDYYPEIILAGRRLNDSMGKYVVSRLIKSMLKKRINLEKARILIMGFAFKENCPDIRNTRVVDVLAELKEYSCIVDIYDPWVGNSDCESEYGLKLIKELTTGTYDAIVIAVAHNQFKDMGAKTIRALCKPNSVIYDLKYVLQRGESELRL